MVLGIVIVGLCLLLLIAGFLAPRLSRRPQHGLDSGLDELRDNAAGHGGITGKIGSKSADTSHKAVDKSTDAGRSARRHVD